MSGGSYNYLCAAYDLASLIEHEGDLSDMAERLAGLGYAEDAAKETEDMLLTIRAFRVRAMTRAERLARVWKAVEWWDSCDWGEDRLHEALAKYRGGE